MSREIRLGPSESEDAERQLCWQDKRRSRAEETPTTRITGQYGITGWAESSHPPRPSGSAATWDDTFWGSVKKATDGMRRIETFLVHSPRYPAISASNIIEEMAKRVHSSFADKAKPGDSVTTQNARA
jgi:hypothetical protein